MKKFTKTPIKGLGKELEPKKDNITARDVAFLGSQVGSQLFNPRNPRFLD